MKKVILLVLVFSPFFLRVFQNINIASVKNSSEIEELVKNYKITRRRTNFFKSTRNT